MDPFEILARRHHLPDARNDTPQSTPLAYLSAALVGIVTERESAARRAERAAASMVAAAGAAVEERHAPDPAATAGTVAACIGELRAFDVALGAFTDAARQLRADPRMIPAGRHAVSTHQPREQHMHDITALFIEFGRRCNEGGWSREEEQDACRVYAERTLRVCAAAA